MVTTTGDSVLWTLTNQAKGVRLLAAPRLMLAKVGSWSLVRPGPSYYRAGGQGISPDHDSLLHLCLLIGKVGERHFAAKPIASHCK